MKLLVKSRAKAVWGNSCDEPHVIVSIRNPESDAPKLATNNHTKGIIFFEFDDLDRIPEKGSATHKALGNPILFDAEMADTVIALLRQTEVRAVIVHCEAGISRSASLAAALAKHFNGDDSEFFSGAIGMHGSKQFHPNLHVYRVMLDGLQPRDCSA